MLKLLEIYVNHVTTLGMFFFFLNPDQKSLKMLFFAKEITFLALLVNIFKTIA